MGLALCVPFSLILVHLIATVNASSVLQFNPSDFDSKIKALLKERVHGKATGGSSESLEPSASVELNWLNFDEKVLKSKDVWIVEFFVPGLWTCEKLAPEWENAANNLQGKVKLGHVDCNAERSLMSRYKVQAFPTILLFGANKDSPVPYEGARTASDINYFGLEKLKTNVAPHQVIELTGPDVMEEKCNSAVICFISFLPDISYSKAQGRKKYLEMLSSAAEKFKRRPFSFVWVAAGEQPDLQKQLQVGYTFPTMVALNAKKRVYAKFESKAGFKRQPIIYFVKEARLGGKGIKQLALTPSIVKTEPWDGKDEEIIKGFRITDDL